MSDILILVWGVWALVMTILVARGVSHVTAIRRLLETAEADAVKEPDPVGRPVMNPKTL